ncbi:MAG: deoxyribodipyrimidine photo-lyase [Proteobacteria bacterium]|nr:deoxyribodipyrimidine photo-lyase [Pseudomonadota bacterium]
MTAQPIIIWFRQDLRLQGHAALAAAVAMCAPIIPLYILDDETPGRWAPGGASRWWLHESLKTLDADLRKRGSRLVLARGPALDVLSDLARETRASAIYWSRCYEPWAVKLERALHRELEGAGVRCRRFSGSLLFEPEDVRTAAGGPYRAFAHFHKACTNIDAPAARLNAPATLPRVADGVDGDRLEAWGLQPAKPDWTSGMAAAWTPGEKGARARLDKFIAERLENYQSARELPGVDGTSQLSPHLHFGEIAPRDVWNAVSRAAAGAKGGKLDEGAECLLRELVWRDFSHHLLFHWPHLTSTPLRTEYANFPWREDADALRAWQEGRTGYPIIDAGMRELWATGWMHHRVRMIVASFLVKHLLISWQSGAEWFHDTLVDADLASNCTNWQVVAGCGADTAEENRIINPLSQGRAIDPEGVYIKSWVPEFAKLPGNRIHAPWQASEDELSQARVRLGETYPEPMVKLPAARERALKAYAAIKTGAQ